MRHASRSLMLVLFAALAGCYSPEIPRMEADRNAPRSSSADLKAHGDERGEVLLSDLAGAYGLEIKVDKVTGRRILENAHNKVVVPPGERYVVVNGVETALEGEIRWRDGQIYLPGDARIVFGEKLVRTPVPSLGPYAGLDDIDPNQPHYPWGHVKTMTKSAPGTVKFDPNAPALPASWNQNANRRWTAIVIHHSATAEGGAKSFGRQHQKKWVNGLGYDFVIGNGTETGDGEVEVGPRWLRQNDDIDGAHAGDAEYNKHGVGICLVGDFDHAQPSPKQMASLRNLVRHLMARYGIKKERIVPHRSVRIGHTECPGKAFPIEAFVHSL